VRQNDQRSVDLVESAVVRCDDQIETSQRRLLPGNNAGAEFGEVFVEPGQERVGLFDGENELDPEIRFEYEQHVEQAGQ
jgi:hypothetical protein